MTWPAKLLPWQRTRIVEDSLAGEKHDAIAARFGVSTQYVGRLRKAAGFGHAIGRPKKVNLISPFGGARVLSFTRPSPVISSFVCGNVNPAILSNATISALSLVGT